jgi:hypothetical protein
MALGEWHEEFPHIFLHMDMTTKIKLTGYEQQLWIYTLQKAVRIILVA